jgi:hypothetical protein
MTSPEPERLVVGGMFRVRYRLDGQRRDREFIGKYLGWSKYYTQHEFDLRPTAGTSQLPGEAIISVELVSSNTPAQQPKMV